jgi:CubicO group peptidase (beta-lactamase class C family)
MPAMSGGIGSRRGGRVAVVAAVLLTSLLSSCSIVGPAPLVGVGSTGGTDAPRPARCELPAPGQDFTRTDPAAVGLDAQLLRAAGEYAASTGAASYRVYRHGCLVLDAGLQADTDDRPRFAFSMTKSVVSLLVGRAVALGALGIDDPIGPHLRRAGVQVDETKADLTVRHLLTQTSGVRMPFLTDLMDASSGDSVARFLERPFEAVPGTRFIYAQTAVTVLGVVVEGAVGADLQDFARDELFHRVGIDDSEWRWERDPAGNTHGWAGLDMSPRAFARLGILAGAGGMWGTDRLIDAAYLDQAQEGGSPTNPCYGFLMRSNRSTRCSNDGIPYPQVYERRFLAPAPIDAFGFSGAFDQETTIIPSLDMVVVRMGAPAFATRDPLGPVEGLFASASKYRSTQLVMRAVLDVPQPEVPDWTPDPDPPSLDLARLIPLPLPEPWPVADAG